MATPIQLGPTHFTLTLTGVAQRLSDVLAAVLAANQGLDMEPQIAQLFLSGAPANAASIQIGSSTVTTADYGLVVAKPATSVPVQISLGPFGLRQLRLSDLYAIGTANDKLQIFLIPAVV